MTQYELGFLGAGNMAEAVVRAAIQQGVLAPEQMAASDPNDQRRAVFSQLGVATGGDNGELIAQARQVLVAVKPQAMAQAATDLGRCGSDDQVVLSIMAGVSSQKLADAIAAGDDGRRPRIVRVMPNLPIQVGFGMAGVALGGHARPGDEALALRLFGAGDNQVILVDEAALDAVTALSGSGPAYVFYLAEAIERAAGELGLADQARVLARQTILGAAKLLSASSDDAQTLRRKVTSPGGTTEAAISHLEAHQAGQTIAAAIHAAADRSVELGR